MNRSGAIGALLAVVLLGAVGASTAAAAGCPQGFACSRVSVPLDRSGAVPGTVQLFVARQKASRGEGKPLLLVLNGGPGGASVPLAAQYAGVLKPVLKRYQLVGYDPRGTGRSGVIDCPGLQQVGEVASLSEMVRQFTVCGGQLGDRAGLYSTAANVEDIDAIRAALGADKVAMLGVSYGTHVIQRYALAHPDRLERAVLDSPIAPGGVNALQLDSFSAVPRVLGDLQHGAVGQTARLVRRLATRPVAGRFGGAVRRMTGSYELYGVLTAGDYSSFLRGEYPAAVRAANAGWSAPLLRLFTIANREQRYPLSEVSFGAYAAATCADTALPWAQDSDLATRQPLFDASVAAVSDASVAPFDRAAVRNLAISGPCLGWPAIATGPDAAPGGYAPIPELTVVGLSDLRTPLESARAVQAAWPGSGLVTVKGAGHGTFTASPCVTRAVLRFLGGAPPANARCTSDEGLDQALARFPTSLRQLTPVGGRGRGRAARAFAAGLATFRDAQSAMNELVGVSRAGRLGGLRGGSFSWSVTRSDLKLRLHDYAYLPGVRVTGSLDYGRNGSGRMQVRGRVRGTMSYRPATGWTGRFSGRHLVEHRRAQTG